MAISQNDLDALDAAIASGAKSVLLDGRSIDYQSTAEMIAARDHAARVLNGSLQNRGARKFRFGFTTHGGD